MSRIHALPIFVRGFTITPHQVAHPFAHLYPYNGSNNNNASMIQQQILVTFLFFLFHRIDARIGFTDNNGIQVGTLPRVAPFTGTKAIETALIVRISAPDVTPQLSKEEAYEIAFGETLSASSQYRACSGGDYEFVPFQTGIIDIMLDEPIHVHHRHTIRPAAQVHVCRYFSHEAECDPALLEGIDHILYLIPGGLADGNLQGWMRGAVGGSYSLYQEPSFAVESILHESSHNFYLGHSRESLTSNPDHDDQEDPEYGDDTGVMGSSYFLWSENGNRRCFNGAHLWRAGWLERARLELSPLEGSVVVNLVGVADVGETTAEGSWNNYVAVKVGDYFVTYNRRKGINADTKEHYDKVLIVQEVPDQRIPDYYDTDLKAVLDQDSNHFSVVLEGGNNGRVELHFLVCPGSSSLDVQRLAIGVNARCDD